MKIEKINQFYLIISTRILIHPFSTDIPVESTRFPINWKPDFFSMYKILRYKS